MNDIIDNEVNDGNGFPALAKEYLRESAKWGKFLAIVGFVMIGFMLIASLFIGAVFSNLPQAPNQNTLFSMQSIGNIMTAMYIVLAIVFFFPTMYLFKFSKKTLEGINHADDNSIVEGLGNLKSTIKFWGIYTAIMIGIYVLIILFGIIKGIMVSSTLPLPN